MKGLIDLILESDKERSTDNFIKGVTVGTLIGSAVGIIAGMLLAPDSGDKTREKLKENVENVKSKVKDQMNGVKDAVKDGYFEINLPKKEKKKIEIEEDDENLIYVSKEIEEKFEQAKEEGEEE
ncbi:YtxH domain-containing protein [Thermohalobacter berrensis]|uniref:Gas vesicle protein n=1 Tax=Thermohalobacter berrensis TaxID=99594 RepID=A0A419T8J9_9FIRM|nr:YtxH domain-containing protein [Thermohalobacter berrensis]RKD33870.1 hypothetical protein BET03_08040 [Thermohalobacter berrensis]